MEPEKSSKTLPSSSFTEIVFSNLNRVDKKIIFLRGFVGSAYKYEKDGTTVTGEETSRCRVYLSPDLDAYIEFDRSAVIHFSKIDQHDLDGYDIWLEPDTKLTYGGIGYEIDKSNHWFQGGVMEAHKDIENEDNSTINCQNTATCPGKCSINCQNTATCPGKCSINCQNTATCPGKCSVNCQNTSTCPGRCSIGCERGAGTDAPICQLPTGRICNKYSTVVGCDEWDFRKNYSPY